jgi:predicted enzyme related to lactoylglutathione lyase
LGIAYDARRDHPKPEFIGLIEDPAHVPNATRLAFWANTHAEVDRVAVVVRSAGARNIEGPMFCPEYSPTYYGLFFEDPSGNRLEVCSRCLTR